MASFSLAVQRVLLRFASAQWVFLLLFAIAVLWKILPLSEVVANLFEAWFSAGVYVFLTLGLLTFFETAFKFDIGSFLKSHPRKQVFVASLLGALPGCGGSIIVVLKFLRGQVTFGALVAALTATMGDSAFLLLARAPADAGLIIALQILAAILMGSMVNWIHGKDFLRRTYGKNLSDPTYQAISLAQATIWSILAAFSLVVLIFALFEGRLLAAETEHMAILILGVGAGAFSLIYWFLTVSKHKKKKLDKTIRPAIKAWLQVVQETCYITAWVFIAYCLYSVSVSFGLNVETILRGWAPLLPLMAMIVGLIPGCGPQILVTTLYLNQLLPFSAQLGNAISTDGDALFPALSLAPTATLIATLYGIVPALTFSYLTYWFFE